MISLLRCSNLLALILITMILLGTYFSEILIGIQTFSFKKMHLNMSSGKMAAILSRPQCVNDIRIMSPLGVCETGR